MSRGKLSWEMFSRQARKVVLVSQVPFWISVTWRCSELSRAQVRLQGIIFNTQSAAEELTFHNVD